MLIFLYLGLIVSVVVTFFYFQSQNRKVKLSSLDEKNYTRILTIRLFKTLFLGLALILFFSLLLPSIIWSVGKKAPYQADKVLDQKQLALLPNNSKKLYVGESTSQDKHYYVINVGTDSYPSLMMLDTDNTQITYIKKSQKPYYEKVGYYKLNMLKPSNVINKNVNDMYANPYLDSSSSAYVKSELNLYLPANTVIQPYEVKNNND